MLYVAAIMTIKIKIKSQMVNRRALVLLCVAALAIAAATSDELFGITWHPHSARATMPPLDQYEVRATEIVWVVVVVI